MEEHEFCTCGGAPELAFNHSPNKDTRGFYVWCLNCSCTLGQGSKTPKQAWDHWDKELLSKKYVPAHIIEPESQKSVVDIIDEAIKNHKHHY